MIPTTINAKRKKPVLVQANLFREIDRHFKPQIGVIVGLEPYCDSCYDFTDIVNPFPTVYKS